MLLPPTNQNPLPAPTLTVGTDNTEKNASIVAELAHTKTNYERTRLQSGEFKTTTYIIESPSCWVPKPNLTHLATYNMFRLAGLQKSQHEPIFM